MLGRAAPLMRQSLQATRRTLARGGDHDYQAPGDSLPFTTTNKAKVAFYVFGFSTALIVVSATAVKIGIESKGLKCKW